MGKLIPLALALVGLGAGVGAGVALRPEPQAEAAAAIDCPPPAEPVQPEAVPQTATTPTEFVKMTDQFVVPLVGRDRISGMVVMSLNLEVREGQRDAALLREPRLRDRLLRVLLDHANAGGFEGHFTDTAAMTTLRRALLEAGRAELGPSLADILILDINRQDV